MTRSNEAFYLSLDGKKADADIHNDILDNPEADRLIQSQAVADAIAEGMEPSLATKLYGNTLLGSGGSEEESKREGEDAHHAGAPTTTPTDRSA